MYIASREQHVHSKGCECGAVPLGTAGGATWQVFFSTSLLLSLELNGTTVYAP